MASLEGKYFAVAISDVHLGHHVFGDESAVQFREFLSALESSSNLEIQHLVIIGDFLDLWRDDDDVLFKKYADILERLGELKTESGKVKSLHYVVGNHDFVMPYYKEHGNEEVKRLLEPFELTKPDCVTPTSLELPNDGSRLNGRKFVIRHGHQDEAGDLALMYDLSAVLLCGQSRESANLLSKLFKYKYETVTALLFLGTALLFALSNILLGGVLLAVSFISLVLWFANYQKHQKTKEFLEVLQQPPKTRRKEFKRLDERMKRRKRRRWDRAVQTLQRREPEAEFPGSRDYRQMQQVLHKRLDRLPGRYQAYRDEIMKQQEILAVQSLEPQDILIRGHTHIVIDGENNEYNPGGWVEEATYCILTIGTEGNIQLEQCKRSPTPSDVARPE